MTDKFTEHRPDGYWAWRNRQRAQPPPPPPPQPAPPLFRGGRCGRSRPPRLFFAVLLIAAGVSLFLCNLGIVPVYQIWNLWPAALILAGVGRLSNRRAAGHQVKGIALIAFGSVFLLMNLGLIHVRTHDGSWPLSLLLIIFGILALVKVLESGGPSASVMGFQTPHGVGVRPNLLNDWVVMGAVKRKIDTANFQGGQILNLLGSVEIDLRRAHISGPNRSAVLEIDAIFGAVKLRLPEDWRLALHGAGVLGTYEDKTIPRGMLAADAPGLVVTGYSIFSTVEIEN